MGAIIGVAGCAEAPAFDPAPIDTALKGFVEDGRVVGVSALVYKDGKEQYFGAYGLRDREAGLPMTRDAIFDVQSMTKPITGVALMRLYDEGRFGLDDPIANYAPEFAGLKVWEGFDDEGGLILVEPKRPPTIRDLGRHTAGFYLRGYESPLQYLVRRVNPLDPESTLAGFAQKLSTMPLLYHPGERVVYAYSMDVQAHLVENITGKGFADYLNESVLVPLRMRNTGYYVPEEKRSRMAANYESMDGVRTRSGSSEGFFHRRPLTPGGHGLVSTIDDYMRFALMILNGGELDGVRLLKPETVHLMGTDQLPAALTDRRWPSPDGDVGWGINFAVRTGPPRSAEAMFGVVGEMYWEGAAGTLFWIDPANNLAAVFMVQQAPYDSLHKDFRDAVYASIGVGFANPPRPH